MRDDFRHILILRGGAIGDFVLTLPAIRAIRERFPSAHIRLLGHPHVTELAVGRGYADSAWRLDDPVFATLFAPADDHPQTSLGVAHRSGEDNVGEGLRSLPLLEDRQRTGRVQRPSPTMASERSRAERHARTSLGVAHKEFESFDLIVAFWKDEGDVLAGNLARVCSGRIVMHDPTPPSDPKRHAVDHLCGVLERVGIEAVDAAPKLFPTRDDLSQADSFCRSQAEPGNEDQLDPATAIAIHPGSGGKTKNWPVERFAEIIKRIAAETDGHVLLTCGPADEDVAYTINELLAASEKRRGGTPFPPRNADGSTHVRLPGLVRPPTGEGAETLPYGPFAGAWARDLPLPVLAAILSKCRAYLGNDSGVTHIAAAVGVPTVAIFGPTDPDVWGPRGKNVAILRGRAPCAPCPREERLKCENRRCMDSVSVDDVWGRLVRLSSR